MNNEELQFQEVVELYENREYMDAANLALELVKNNVNSGESFLIFTKAYLFLIFDPSDEDMTGTFYNAAKDTLKYAETREEYYRFRHEIQTTFNEWHEQIIRSAIGILESKMSMSTWGDFIDYPVNISKMWLITTMSMNEVPVPETDSDENCDFEEKEITNEFTSEEMKEIVFDAACNIFERTKTRLEEEQHSSAEHCQNLVDIIMGQLTLARLMVDYAIPDIYDDTDMIDESIIINRLEVMAAIREYKLNAMLYPNGIPMTLYQSGRHDILKGLDETYKKIKKLDPSYVIPTLPNVEPIVLPRTNQSSGGCYVATAVYGSYDCPEVWTLRRYRDNIMADTVLGRIFIRIYYAISPSLVRRFGKTLWFNKIFKSILDKKVEHLNNNGIENTKYQDKEW